MMVQIIVPGILVFCGLFSAVCAIKDYDWFMEHRKARTLVRIMGRTATRAFYAALGAGLVLAGIIMSIVELQKV